jgi:two-component system nitrogen regulation sensor histidine kinase NtrY
MWKQNKRYLTYILLFILTYTILIVGDKFIIKNDVKLEGEAIQRIQNKLASNELKFEQIVNDTQLFSIKQILQFDSDIKKKLDNDQMYLLVYYGDSLCYWSDNHISVDSCLGDLKPGNSIIRTRNGYFQLYKKAGYYNYLCLYQIKSEYNIQNKHISNQLNNDFNIDADVNISLVTKENYEKIYDKKGNYLFSISINNTKLNYPLYFKCIEILLIIFLISLIELSLKYAIQNKKGEFLLVCFFSYIIFFRLIPISIQSPQLLYELGIFNPLYYANNNLFSSLGDYILNILVCSRTLYLSLKYINQHQIITKRYKSIFNIIFFFIKICVLSIVTKGIISLIIDSSISIDISKHSLNQYSIILLCTIAFTSILYFLFADLLNILKNNRILIVNNPLISLLYLIIGFGLLIFVFKWSYIYALCLLTLIVFYDWLFHSKKFNKSQKNSFIIPVIAAFLTGLIIYDNNIHKENEIKKLFAQSLIDNSDYRIEQILPEIDKKINNDVKLNEFLWSKEVIQKYLKNRYFSGYMSKYDVNVYLTNNHIESLNQSIDTLYHAQSFKIDKTNFVKTNVSSPIMGYLGKYTRDSVNIYVVLQPKNYDTENGLYEILSEINYSKENENEFYSWASYKQGKLFNSHGVFNYPIYLTQIENKVKENENTHIDEWTHVLYKEKNGLSVLISKESDSWSKPISYIGFSITFFILFFLVLILINLSIIYLKYLYQRISNHQKFDSIYSQELKNNYITGGLNLSLISVRIQLTIGAVIVITLLVTIFVNQTNITKIYNKNQIEKLNIKLKDVKLETEKYIKIKDGFIQTEQLEEQINPIIEIYHTDINIFDAAGSLIYSSQPRIFESGIMSSKINENTIKSIYINGSSHLIQNEHLGKLEYLSAYTPLVVNDRFIGYLNIPYFAKQAELTEAIKTNLISLITPYTFIFIVIGILSWLITSSFVRRLNVIREKISTTVLGKKNTKINWHTPDEIGDLVNQYNIMVDTLAQSADTLAQNERNEAWREMAKQIAHEIKNPLTPMKLNLQQLQKAYQDNHPKKEEIMAKVSRVLVEQIDALANLATEFSNFAKMPESKREIINVCALLDDIKTLFDSDENINIKYIKNTEDIYIFADADEIKRVFTNLIKNAIQAIPEDRKGIIEISSLTNKNLNLAEITVKDNGDGIPKELEDKIFVPNFSTKNSGMGLGLAMVKKIIENNGGAIRYESKLNTGTIFYIELPLTQS